MEWYQTQEAFELLKNTENGRFAYIWKAVYDDGTIHTQFPDQQFAKYIEESVPVDDTDRVSVDKLDVRKVQEFVLIPTGIGRTHAPWLNPVRLVVDNKAGEKFISFWCVDRDMFSGREIARHVVGISKPVNGAQAKFFVTVSPSGNITVATNENLSYEGE